MSVRQYVGARYVPKFSDVNDGVWDDSYTYEPLIIVKHGNDYYTSKKEVPTGIAITNTEYWVLTGNYNGAIAELHEEIEGVQGDISDIQDEIEGITVNNPAKTPDEFGAKGDGVTDDTLAVQAAIDSGNCLLLEKTYRITSPLYVNINTTSIKGVSSRSQIFADFSADGYAIIFHSDSESDHFDKYKEGNIHGDFGITGDASKHASGILIGGNVSTAYEGQVCLQHFQNITFDSVNKCIGINRHAFSNEFEHLTSNSANYGIYTEDRYDTGECNTFINCILTIGSHYINTYADFIGCAFHILEGNARIPTGNSDENCDIYTFDTVRFIGCHFERLTRSDSASNDGVGIFVNGEAQFMACEFVSDAQSRVCKSIIKTGANAEDSLKQKVAYINGCSIFAIFRNTTTFTEAAFSGNVRIENCFLKCSNSSNNVKAGSVYSTNAARCLSAGADVWKNSDNITVTLTDTDSGLDISAAVSAYVDAITLNLFWDVDVSRNGGVILPWRAYSSAGGSVTFRYLKNGNQSHSVGTTLTFYDQAGNIITGSDTNAEYTKVNENHDAYDTFANRAFGIPANAVKMRIGVICIHGATSSGTHTFHLDAPMIFT